MIGAANNSYIDHLSTEHIREIPKVATYIYISTICISFFEENHSVSVALCIFTITDRMHGFTSARDDPSDGNTTTTIGIGMNMIQVKKNGVFPRPLAEYSG